MSFRRRHKGASSVRPQATRSKCLDGPNLWDGKDWSEMEYSLTGEPRKGELKIFDDWPFMYDGNQRLKLVQETPDGPWKAKSGISTFRWDPTKEEKKAMKNNKYPGYKIKRVVWLSVFMQVATFALWLMLPKVEAIFCPFWSDFSGHTEVACARIIHWLGAVIHILFFLGTFIFIAVTDCDKGIDWKAEKTKKEKKMTKECQGCPALKSLASDVRPYAQYIGE